MLEERTLLPESTEEVGSLVSKAQGSGNHPRVTFNAPEKSEEEPPHRKLAKLTVKYNRKDLQRWLDLEEWIDTQLQKLYPYQEEEEETDATAAPEPEIDIEDLLDISNEEQESKLQGILQECSKPTEDFVTELLSRLRGLRKVTNPQKK
ncbi:protein phosphatase 1 regulatory subunit 14D [Anolis carolinensis]|uniref:Protein phosphatase 1 regulatory subunit 14D n=1 Tax=Anolis carolinensis TaxID=28377 RepID=H9G7F4_ANOCA|nr:PREDICTED: protein phosphatase 1 regulatory subunit 14D [Anolis carolinensis]XP_016851414.1 PREDICTED: protein phosphatase 1 regulatory subunit 14D [Anolis carolinensis]|eukprot:XP_003224837.1 PREDICTED: protein phosphatase 1 regulatory subunit 14D [Anolis carolinensis]